MPHIARSQMRLQQGFRPLISDQIPAHAVIVSQQLTWIIFIG
jgi:hypothetical protein